MWSVCYFKLNPPTSNSPRIRWKGEGGVNALEGEEEGGGVNTVKTLKIKKSAGAWPPSPQLLL